MTTSTPNPHVSIIAAELRLRNGQVQATATLLDDGATLPFIARYRKEVTGEMDEVQIESVRDRLEQLRALDERRAAILSSLEERDLLTDELRKKVMGAPTMAVLEDIYLPYRPKRRTRATIAREKGLEPLALSLWEQDPSVAPLLEAELYIDGEKGVEDAAAALAGARDIIAEWVSEDEAGRRVIRALFASEGVLRSGVAAGKKTEGAKFRDYFEWEERAWGAPSHRVLAIFRGEQEGVLSVHIGPPEETAVDLLLQQFVHGWTAASEQVRLASEDGYQRLLGPSMDTEARNTLKEEADRIAIGVFADNLRNLLLAAPLGQKRVLGIDPGFRTGCKIVCLDRQGKLVHTDVAYLHMGEEATVREAQKITAMVKKFSIDAIAIGNGTAGRETETVVRSLHFGRQVQIVMVNESGASVYSASAVAREEFPDEDITVRGAVSIGRRLADPLAELVKIDPKAIGVGQYQHDVDQSALAQRLHDVVVSCVNLVGVDLNTASARLLTFISGLGPNLAKAIVQYREANGAFHSRDELLKVPRLGPKAFEQAAGFLRVTGGENPLDASGVHPESYPVVARMAADAGCTVKELIKDDELRELLDLKDFVTDTVGLPTLNDIMAELSKPGRDPRKEFEAFSFDEDVHAIGDVTPGMKLPGIVTNVTAFGAFVDVGVHQDGLVHISQMADRFVSDPHEIVAVAQHIMVRVLDVDLDRGRISLSMGGV